ncbi:hypothetical protein DM02DRAFT_59215 [Periconia macrospinosa]|uniref:Uncharacterized protein n=1 Tax=Periconia macrospinosa TaxID=97972 RepID=A0A2V1DLY1_9PLEO|nr:hypothetical protein DM02DRAFT_59215 [Periconia macrospinosa]
MYSYHGHIHTCNRSNVCYLDTHTHTRVHAVAFKNPHPQPFLSPLSIKKNCSYNVYTYIHVCTHPHPTSIRFSPSTQTDYHRYLLYSNPTLPKFNFYTQQPFSVSPKNQPLLVSHHLPSLPHHPPIIHIPFLPSFPYYPYTYLPQLIPIKTPNKPKTCGECFTTPFITPPQPLNFKHTYLLTHTHTHTHTHT